MTGIMELQSVADTIKSPLREQPGCDSVMTTVRVQYGGKACYRRGEGEQLLMSFDEVQGTNTTLMVLV